MAHTVAGYVLRFIDGKKIMIFNYCVMLQVNISLQLLIYGNILGNRIVECVDLHIAQQSSARKRRKEHLPNFLSARRKGNCYRTNYLRKVGRGRGARRKRELHCMLVSQLSLPQRLFPQHIRSLARQVASRRRSQLYRLSA